MGGTSLPVTLNCSGGIALGAYMAGVFTELVKASLRPGPGDASPALRIDTITGASAGAMTGLIAARSLLQDPARALQDLADDGPAPGPAGSTGGGSAGSSDSPRNGFYRAWVQLADIRALTDYATEEQALRPARGEVGVPRTRLGLLSGASIAAITDEVGGSWAAADLHGMRRALQHRNLAVLMTTTNLQGVLRTGESDRQRSVSHAETRRFLFHHGMQELGADPDSQAEATRLALLNGRWQKAKDSARASGAFPLAFPPLANDSDPSSINLDLNAASLKLYEDRALTQKQKQNHNPGGADPDRVIRRVNEQGQADDNGTRLRLRFDYTDGGVLDGLPILKGIGLLNSLAALQAKPADTATGAPALGNTGGTGAATSEERNAATNGVKGDQKADDKELLAFATDWVRTALDESRRRFVYVQPIPVTDLGSNPSLLQNFFGALATGLAGLTYPKAEHDHLRLEEIEAINRQVRERERLIKALGLADSDPEAIHLRRVLPYREVSLDPIDPVLTFRSPAFQQLLFRLADRSSFPAGTKTPAGAPQAAIAGASAGATNLEAAALQCFEQLIGTPPEDQTQASGALSPKDLLASDVLAAFGGFFHERFRRHDYLIGRLSGLAWLLETSGETDLVEAELLQLLERAPRDYLPRAERSNLRPLDWLRLLHLAAVRLPYVLLNDLLAQRSDPSRPLPPASRWLLRRGVAPVLGLLVLLLLLLGGLAALPALILSWLLAAAAPRR